MTNDKTVTIPLELAERLDSPHSSVRIAAIESLRRILAAPVVERQELAAYRYKEGHASWENEKPWEPTTLEHGAVLLERKALAANGTLKGDSQAYYLALAVEPLYTSPPAPVAAIDEMQAFSNWLHESVEFTHRADGVSKVQRKDVMSLHEEKISYEAWSARACLDKVKELNR